jgi:dTDP-4-amino-4,6-dideoxygalactose transaminase
MPHNENFIPIAKPSLGEAESRAASRAILSGWLTQGPEVAAFESEFAAYVGAPYACAVCNCTTALHLALLAVGVRPGDEVITVSHSFIATANSILYCGGVPVFVDIEPETYNVDPKLIESAVSGRTRAILCVHQLGMPCDLAAIVEIGRRKRIPVIEDAACAIGSEVCWQGTWEKIGKPHADIACFSLHPRKLLTTGDGGMITTSNAEWMEKFRRWRQHGMSIPDTVRHHSKEVVFETYPVVGYNYRLTDVQAAIGREQLKRLPPIIETRRTLATRYQQLLSRIPGIGLPAEPNWAKTNWQSYCVRLPAGCDQRAVMQHLLDRGIATRRGVMCAHREGAAQGTFRSHPAGLKQSEYAQDHAVVLPLYHQLTAADQDRVVAALKAACAETRDSNEKRAA